MITGEIFPGEAAEILVEAFSDDGSGERVTALTTPVVYIKQYKESAVQATGATAVYDPTMGQFLISVPPAYIPASGTIDGVLKAAGIWDVVFRLQVNTADTALAAIKAKTDTVDWTQIEKMLIMAIGNDSGLVNGVGSTITFTSSGIGTAVFTVDANGNRTLSSLTLV